MSLYRKNIFFTLAFIVPLGFYSKFYSGPFARYVNIYLGGVFYVIFWALLVALIFPRFRVVYNVISVFSITCALEFLQLWHPLFLGKIRSVFIGRALIGTTFSFLDIVHYTAGSFIVYVFLCRLQRKHSIKI
ncbi:DUF2809 domain-containing protein [candidate division KSB1 bacterium]|nr:MAG: DUF2809 domain-containing protein [candidate division KSB1 bacterium]